VGDNIKANLRETGFEDVECIEPTQYRIRWKAFVNTVMKFWFKNV
jgi:hypothetical protein